MQYKRQRVRAESVVQNTPDNDNRSKFATAADEIRSAFELEILKRQAKKVSLTEPAITLAVMMMDALVILAGSMVAWYGYHYVVGTQVPDVHLYVQSALLLSGLFFLRGIAETVYGPLWGVSHQGALMKTLSQFTQAFLIFVTALVLLRWSQTYSRGSLITQYVICGASILALRAAQFQLVNQGRLRQFVVTNRVVMVGDAGEIAATRRLWRERRENVEILKAFPLPVGEGVEIAPDQLSSFAEHVIGICRAAKPDRILVLLPFERSKEISYLVERFADVPASILVSTEQLAATQTKPEVLNFGGRNMLRVVRKPLTSTERILKRLTDVSASALLLLMLSPLLIGTAILIKLDSRGPVFFRQKRKGFNQRVFSIYKFRTMKVSDPGETFRQTARDDCRITRIGKFLRKWNIDELPQLLNVLRGEMSLVGPRPHAIEHDDEYTPQIAIYARRHNIKPGITGLAQALGFRGATETLKQMQDRVSYDLLYIQTWSIFLDLKILFMTAFLPRAYRNAY